MRRIIWFEAERHSAVDDRCGPRRCRPFIGTKTVVENHVTGTIVAVARLAHRPDVDQQLAVAQPVFKIDLLGRQEPVIFGDDAGDMSVAVKAAAIDKLKQSLDLSMVVDVFRENVFAQRIARRTVNVQELAIAVRSGKPP